MNSLTGTNAKLALHSIRTSKLRSFLTMLGIIISVTSVIVAVSLGEGVRHQVSGQVNQVGKDIITIRPGKLVERNEDGSIRNVNYSAALGINTLTDQDLNSTRTVRDTREVVPVGVLSGAATNNDGRSVSDTSIIVTTAEFPDIVQQKIQYGAFFSPGDNTRSVAVIGKGVAEKLFQENVPIGKTVTIRDNTFIIQGVFERFSPNILNTVADFNDSIFIPYNTAKSISGNNVHLAQILVKPENPADADEIVRNITTSLKRNHGGQEDFTALTQSELLSITSSATTVATSFVTGIAAISLLVGGIGIMNIMFVSVTERTREIGVRKSLGATNRQIYSQFLMEAAVLSFVGGIIGVLLALLADFLLRILTNLQPVITLPIMVLAVAVSVGVGIIFGTVPAIKAARKDPIQALRYE